MKSLYDNGREFAEECSMQAWLWNLDWEWSDHAPIKLTLWRLDCMQHLGDKPFRFEQIWTSEVECERVIEVRGYMGWLWRLRWRLVLRAWRSGVGINLGQYFVNWRKNEEIEKAQWSQLSANQSILGCASIQIQAKWEVRVAKAISMLWGLQMALDLQLSNTIMESDSILVIQTLKGEI